MTYEWEIDPKHDDCDDCRACGESAIERATEKGAVGLLVTWPIGDVLHGAAVTRQTMNR